MRVECEHGYFRFYPAYSDEVFDFMNYFKETLEWEGRFYTFPVLRTAKNYSLVGKAYSGITATKTFEGDPAKVFRQNSFVYNVRIQSVVALSSISKSIELVPSNGEMLAPSSLVQPGSMAGKGKILSYEGRFEIGLGELVISTVEYA
jgi:hypothetical protein